MAKRASKSLKAGLIRKSKYSILIVIGIIYLYTAFRLIIIGIGYAQIDHFIEQIQNNYLKIIEDNPVNGLERYFRIDWDGLLARNNNVVGWIYVPGTNINLPVMHTNNNQRYLNTDVDGNQSRSGSIFVQANNNPNFNELNTILHGHNMQNNTMFSAVHRIATREITDVNYIYIYLPNNVKKIYQIVSINRIYTDNALYQNPPISVEGYFELMQKGKVYSSSFNRAEARKFITLSTCGSTSLNSASRSVIYGVLIDEIVL